jgi:hypothetical protein
MARNWGIDNPCRWLRIARRMYHIMGGAASSNSPAQSIADVRLLASGNDCMLQPYAQATAAGKRRKIMFESAVL